MATVNRLVEYIPGQIWLKEYPIRFAGCRFNARMCVIRLSDGRLLIHSPCPIDVTTKNEIDALGSVAVIVAPGDYHHFNLRSACEAFPDAAIQLCPGVERKIHVTPSQKIIGDEPDAIWAQDLDHVLIRGSRFIREIAFYHRKTATLILVDLIENFGDNTPDVGGLLKFWWRLFGMWNRAKPAPEYQLGWTDKAAASQSLERILAWDFTRIILAHGDLIEVDAPQTARDAWRKVLQAPSEHQAGYEAAHSTRLLKDFDETCALMEETIRAKYGAGSTQRMLATVRDEYNALIPEIPKISGFRAKMFNWFLVITAQELAAYKGLKQFDLPVEDIWHLCHEAIQLRVNTVPKWKRWLLKQWLFSTFIKKLMSRRARLNQTGRLGDFEIEYLDADNEPFDIGINYRRCGNYNFVMKHGGAALAPYVCLSDIALSEAFGWGLVRTQTLADGCDHCDFRMSKDGPTRISSRTPDVQRAIELIRTQESDSSLAG